jgi:hypothetical protein
VFENSRSTEPFFLTDLGPYSKTGSQSLDDLELQRQKFRRNKQLGAFLEFFFADVKTLSPTATLAL